MLKRYEDTLDQVRYVLFSSTQDSFPFLSLSIALTAALSHFRHLNSNQHVPLPHSMKHLPFPSHPYPQKVPPTNLHQPRRALPPRNQRTPNDSSYQSRNAIQPHRPADGRQRQHEHQCLERQHAAAPRRRTLSAGAVGVLGELCALRWACALGCDDLGVVFGGEGRGLERIREEWRE